ncbi:MAG TPA: SpoIIE family protein phosphatase [Nocardioidaceae bacterium]|nr:SpoIIE family protein phosphatase [Nocardioidaceae bacterium]
MHIQGTFAPEGRSVSEARRFVRGALEGWGAGDLADEAVLAASELVTNAVVHAGTPVRVVLELDAGGLRLEVEDLHPHRTLPLGLEGPPDESEHGRGLLIAATLATSWGVDYTAGAKRIWLRFERAGATVEATATAAAVTGASDGDWRGGAEPAEADVAVVELDAEGAVRSWNHDAVRMFGWRPEDVLGRPWLDLAEPFDGAATTRAGSGVPSWTEPRRQGLCTVRTKGGLPVQAFESRLSGPPGEGAVVLLVPAARRALLEWPESRRRMAAAPERHDPLGLREDALERLGFQAYLDLVVERARDQLGGHAAYLLLVRDLDADYEVSTVSGLDSGIRGSHLEPGTPGTPPVRNPHLPTTLTDVAEGDVPWLAGEEVRSLLVAPVVMEQRVIGALGVTSDRAAGFDDEQAVHLQRLGAAVASAADRARLRTSERERRGWLGFLAEAGVLLGGSLDQEMTMAITGQIVVPRLATWCAVYLDDSRGESVLQQVWHRDEQATGALREALVRSGSQGVAESPDERLGGDVLDLPLTARGRRFGVLTLGRTQQGPLYGEALVVAEAITRRAALAIDNAHVHGELQAVGEALQRGLLPARIPASETFEVGVVYEAAGERALAGGDFYDIFPVGSGRWCFAVGDVCGTGAEAAAVTGLARHTVRALALTGFPVAATLERLNTAILDEGERARFLTLVCGTLEPAGGGRLRLTLVSAGHPPPFVVRRGGLVERVGRPQSLLGVWDDVTFVADEHVLERGDLLVAVTDGVLERREGLRMLGEEGLEADLAQVVGLPAQAVADRIRRLVSGFASTAPADDMAVLAIRVP